MKFVLVYLRLYGACLGNAFAALAKNVWTLLLPMGLAVGFFFLALLVSPLGALAGGLIMSLVKSAAFSVYTFFLSEVVAKARASLSDFKASIGAYFWSWVNLFFVLWIVDLLLSRTVAMNPNGVAILQVVSFMELVVLNAAPEIIYLKRSYGGLETIQRSFAFLQENWIEWFVPNGLVLGGLWLFLRAGGLELFGMLGSIGFLLLAGAAFHVLMVFRGFVFEALDGSTHRQRMFRYGGTR